MRVVRKIFSALVGVSVFIVPTFAAPAITGTGLASSDAVSAFGLGGSLNTASANTSTGVMSIASGNSAQGIALGGTSPIIAPGSLEDVVKVNNLGQGTNLFATTGAARVVGLTQTFTLSTASTVSFDYTSVRPTSGFTGDPFVFLLDMSNPSTPTVVQFVRAANSGRVLLSNTTDDFVFGGTSSTGSTVNSSYFTMGTFLNAGSYLIGFGYGVSPTGSAGSGSFTVSNVVATAMVPEIDAGTAGLPVAIALMVLCLVLDRRRSAVSV